MSQPPEPLESWLYSRNLSILIARAPSSVADLRKAIRAGASIDELAASFGVSRQALSQRMKRLGLPALSARERSAARLRR